MVEVQLSISFQRDWTEEQALRRLQSLFDEIMKPGYVLSATVNGEEVSIHTLHDDVLEHRKSQLVEWQCLSPSQQRLLLKVRRGFPTFHSLKGGEYATFSALKRRGYVQLERWDDGRMGWAYRVGLTDSGLALMEQLEREAADDR